MPTDITIPGSIGYVAVIAVAVLLAVICLMDHSRRMERLRWKELLSDAEEEQNRLQSIIDYQRAKLTQRWFFMIPVPNNAVKTYRIRPGLDADGKPGTMPEDAVLVWGLTPVNGDAGNPPTLTVSEDKLEATVDFEDGVSNDEWRVTFQATSESNPDWVPFAETDGYKIMPGIAQTFVIDEVS